MTDLKAMGVADVMTAEEFEAEFLRDCYLSPEAWREMGLRVVPCECGLRDCPGWQITLPEAGRPTTRLQRLRMTPAR